MVRELSRGVRPVGRTQSFRKSGRWQHVTKAGKSTSTTSTTTTSVTNKWYEADDVSTPIKSRKKTSTKSVTKLRKSITPGTVLILLAGRFRGKRVVFLKQLEKTGLLLVVGPFKINGVPLRRVNQAYVIATSTTVNLKNVNLSAIKSITDATFATTKSTTATAGFTDQNGSTKAQVSDAIKNATKAVDAQLVPLVKKTEFLSAYLNARFSLSKNDRPHLMKF